MIQDRSIACEIRNKIRKLGFLGMIMRTHEQACVRIIKPTYTAKIMCTWVSVQKP